MFFTYSMPDRLVVSQFTVDFNDVSSPAVVSAADLTSQLQVFIDS